MPERSRRVVFYDAYPHTYGGAQIVTHMLAVGLRGRGWQTELVVPMDGPLVAAARRDGVEVTVLAAPPALLGYGRVTQGVHLLRAAAATPRYWSRLANHLRGAAVLHADDHRGILLAGVPARVVGVPCIWHVHSVQRNTLLNRICARLSHEIILPARAVLGPMPELARHRHPTVISNPVQTRFAGLGVRRPPGRPRLVTIARYHPDKGLDVLLAAVGRVRQAVPDVEVVVLGAAQVGWESYEQSFRSLLTELELDSVVNLPGWTDSPEVALGEASIYVQPSRDMTEIAPLAILEAMALGVPVVASRVGGIAEIVRDGITGLLVPAGDPQALAAALTDLLLNPDRAAAMGAQGRREVQKENTIEAMLDRTETVYARVADGAR